MQSAFHVSHVADGNMSYAYGRDEETSCNRLRFISGGKLPSRQAVAAHLTHSCVIREVGKDDWGKGIYFAGDAPEADVLVTSDAGTLLFANVADCLAIGFFDHENQVCALAHVGFRGTQKHLPLRTIRLLQDEFGSDPSYLTVQFSPALQSGKYFLRSRADFPSPEWDKYVRRSNEGEHIDWVAYCADQCLSQGVRPENLILSRTDTYVTPTFYSHERQARSRPGEHVPVGNHGVVAGWAAIG